MTAAADGAEGAACAGPGGAGEIERVLHTPGGLRLEPLVAAHAEAAFALLREPALYEFEGEPPASVAALRERYRRLESRGSADGSEQWLNWAVRAPAGLVGLVQATVRADGCAFVAYQFAPSVWGRGWASQSVATMAQSLAADHGAHTLVAVYKRANLRSERLLRRLHFVPAPPVARPLFEAGDDEGLTWRAAPRGIAT